MNEYQERPDEQLVAMVHESGSGDLRAFDQLVERHQRSVLANCRYMTRSPDDAADLAQEVFVKAYFGLRRFRGDARFKTWLHRIKINHCLNYLSKKKREPEFVDVDQPGVEAQEPIRRQPAGERKLESAEARERIGRVLDAMTDTLRVPLLMRDLDHFSYQEIAERLGIGLSAVKMRIKRGREEFRRLFDEMEGGDG